MTYRLNRFQIWAIDYARKFQINALPHGNFVTLDGHKVRTFKGVEAFCDPD